MFITSIERCVCVAENSHSASYALTMGAINCMLIKREWPLTKKSTQGTQVVINYGM